MQYQDNSALNQLPTQEDTTLPAFFENAVEKLYYQKTAPYNNLPDFEVRMEQETVWKRFTALAIGYPNTLAGLPHL